MKRFIIGSGWLMVVTFVAVAVMGTSNEFCLDSGCDFSKTACSKRANGCHQENRTLDGGAGVDGDVGTNDGVITGGDGGNSAHGQGGDGGMGVTGGIDVNHGTVGGGSGGGTDDGTPGSDGVPYGGSVGVNDGTVVKARVNVPQLAAKAYSGARQMADVPDDPRWGVVFNDGGTSVGTYRVGLVLADPDRYCWVDAQDEFAFPSFTVSKAVIDVSGVAWAYSGPFNYTAECGRERPRKLCGDIGGRHR